MSNSLSKEVHFERCPRCNWVLLIKKDSDVVVCEKCGTKIKIKK